jgi:hypothetical protein
MLHSRHHVRARAAVFACRARARNGNITHSFLRVHRGFLQRKARRSMTLDLRKSPYALPAPRGGMRIGHCAIAGVACPFVVLLPARAMRTGVIANP